MIKNTKEIVAFVMQCYADKKKYWSPVLAGKQFNQTAAAADLTNEMEPHIHKLCYKYGIQELEVIIKSREDLFVALKDKPADAYWETVRHTLGGDITYLKERLSKHQAALIKLLE